jgi:cytochrome P450
MLYLMSSPIFYLKLRNEIDAAIRDGEISSPITDAEAKELPYLQGVIKEGLRIFPPAAGMTPRTVPPGGDTFNGVFIPEGTDVGYAAFSVHRSKTIYGEDAEVFRPEWWLEEKDEERVEDDE